jgi:hypothetical protein
MPLKITDLQNRLNPFNTGFDAIAGDNSAGGTGYPLYQSLLGVEIEVDNATAKMLSNTTIGTLYGGLYRYLGVLSPAANTVVRGQAAFWATTQTGASIFATDGTQYTVSIDPSASIGDGLFAGVALVAGAAASGSTFPLAQFGWFQTLGLASVNVKATPSDNTIGDACVVVTDAVTFDSRADATGTLTWGGAQGIKNFVGVFVEAPGAATAAAVKRVLLKVTGWPLF